MASTVAGRQGRIASAMLRTTARRGNTMPMQYRRLGRAACKVSELSLGSWVTYHNQVDARRRREMLAAAFDAGVNFFDNAEVYAARPERDRDGRGDQGAEVAAPELRRLDQVLLGPRPRRPCGQPQGHAQPQVPDAGDRRLAASACSSTTSTWSICHRPDPNTPIEETVWAMSDMITRGKALYWGTSEWSAAEIRAAWDIAERHHLHKPVMEQPQYNLFHRKRVEQEYARLYEDIGLGLTTWSPLASGLLTGKYRSGMPAGSRGAMESMGLLRKGLTDAAKNAAVGAARSRSPPSSAAALAQLAIAWARRTRASAP